MIQTSQTQALQSTAANTHYVLYVYMQGATSSICYMKVPCVHSTLAPPRDYTSPLVPRAQSIMHARECFGELSFN